MALVNLYTLAAPISLLWLCIVQAVFATFFSIFLQHERWWKYIHFIFPLAVYVTSRFEIPSLVYLLAFLFLLSLHTASFKNRVPYFPSKTTVWARVNDFLTSRNAKNFIDLGSGLGGLVLHLKLKNPALTVIGIEMAPLPWFISVLRKKLAKSDACFILGDYQALNLGQYDAIFTYLSPAPMEYLYEKAVREMRRNTLFLSHEFPIPNIKPSYLLDRPDDGSVTYVYVM
jgi:hypothetical protein